MDEQGWLVARLAELVKARGWEPLITNPILEPSDEYFPTRWTNDGAGYYWTTRRILRFAGLDDLDPVIEVFQAGSETPDVPDIAAAWFGGIEEGRCRFGVKLSAIQDAEEFVAAMAHEVAHAYRSHYLLRHEDRREEELLTDLTTIYLGFGLLSTNASYRYRVSGRQAGMYAITQWSHSHLGYLPLQAMTFLLSLQMVVRGEREAELRRIRRGLEPTQRAGFDEGMKRLGPIGDDLRLSLGIPDPSQWPSDRESPVALEALEGTPRAIVHKPRTIEVGRGLPNTGRPIYRIRISSTVQFGLIGVPIAVAVLGLGAILGWPPLAAVGLPCAIPVLLGILGSRRIRDVCSDPNCGNVIPPGAEVCSRCGGAVSEEADSRPRG
jgi:hypothetical protein